MGSPNIELKVHETSKLARGWRPTASQCSKRRDRRARIIGVRLRQGVSRGEQLAIRIEYIQETYRAGDILQLCSLAGVRVGIDLITQLCKLRLGLRHLCDRVLDVRGGGQHRLPIA